MCLFLFLPIASATVAPGSFSGVVVDGRGEPVPGVMVGVRHRELDRTTTSYSDAAGRFRIPSLEGGAYTLRARRPGYEDFERHGVETGSHDLRIELEWIDDPRQRAWQLPASRWLPLLLGELSSDAHREEMTRQCTFCHQQGNWATRVARSPEEWDKIFTLMARMGGVLSPDLRAELPAAFNRAYSERSYLAALTEPFVSLPVPEGDAARAVITSWDVGHPASMQHDLVVHPDGRVYSVDTNQDKLYRLDPETGERRSWPIPRGDSPLGGVFHVTGALVAPNSNAHVGPHSLQVAPDGAIWVTLCLGNKVARFDPSSEQWDIWEQEEGFYPHTLRFDDRGRVWYTLAVSNHVGMIDPRTGEQHAIRLPARTWTQAIAVRVLPLLLWVGEYVDITDQAAGEGVNLPVPYGIDIAPDGGVWFSQLNEHRIGRIDPDTFDVETIDTPFPGPRRLRFDSRGNLWIPGFSTGRLGRYDTKSGEFRTWELPIRGVETPYALNVDRRTDTVWICGTNSDSLIRFEPETERFTVFPLPTRVTYTREIDFDEDGGVWTSNSNFPAWQIEGSGPALIRLQPGENAATDEHR